MLNLYEIGDSRTMIGREEKKSNDLFFTCGLIEYLARNTHNHPSFIVHTLGETRIAKIYELADIYHSDNIDRVSNDLIEECHIRNGSFDNVSSCEYSVPTHWDIGKVYKRLILKVAEAKRIGVIHALIEVYESRIVDLIEDYNSSFYYDSPSAIFETYSNDCIPVADE